MSNSRIVADRLDEDERRKLNLPRQGETWFVTESGLYAVIVRSDKPNARKFRKWVTSEVLPSIRKTGSYNKPMTTARKLYAFLEMDKSHYSRWVKANIVDNEFATEMRIIFTRHQWRMKVAGAILLMITNSQPISQRTDGTARKGFNDNKIRNSLF